MRKIIVVFLIAVCAWIPFLGVNQNKVLAQESKVVPSQIRLEYSEDGILLPSLLVDGYIYTISLYAINDTGFEECLMENLQYGTIESPNVGSYLLKYDLINTATGVSSVETSILTILDVQAPELFLQGSYSDSLVVGDTLELLEVSVYDKSGETITNVSYKVYRDGMDVTASVENKKLALKAGEYTIIYTAKDSANNEGELVVTLSVAGEREEGEEESDSGCNSSLSVGILPVFAIVAGIMLKKKKEA